jgi:serine/threonine protein kinase
MIFGDFRLEVRLEEGRLGQAYRAVRRECLGSFARPFLVKLFRRGLTQSTPFARTLIESVGRASALSHSTVVTAEELGVVDVQYFLASEYIAGTSLATVCAAAKSYQAPFPVLQAALIGAQVAAALDQAQELDEPLAHGHLTPWNILLTPDGEVRVTDFGLADAVARLPRAMLTPAPKDLRYLSPEQSSAPLVSGPADLYSLGLILYELLAACHPYDFAPDVRVAELVNRGVPRPIGDVVDLAADLTALLDRMLVVDPVKRLGSAREVYEELSGLLDRSGLPRADPTLRQIVWELRGQQGTDTQSAATADATAAVPSGTVAHPAAEKPSIPVVAQTIVPKPAGNTKRILVVDDSRTIQQAFRITFSLQDVELLTASNGEEGLKLAGHHRPHLIFVDHDLRFGPSGYDVLASLKGDPRLTYIPVVLCFGGAQGVDADRAAKANARIAKPFETQEILDLTAKLLKS